MQKQFPMQLLRSQRALVDSMARLEATIRNANESLLDLEEALIRLHLAYEPGQARELRRAARDCIQRAMGR